MIYRRITNEIELLEYRRTGDIVQVQVALNGVLAPMIDDSPETRQRFASDEEYFKYIAWQSQALIHLFGDARFGLSEEQRQRNEKEAFIG